jgi:hypothetical protein
MSQIISYSDANEKVLFSRIERFFSDFGLSKLLLKCNFYKASGFSCVLILKQLFSLIFSGKNLYRALDLNNDDLSFRKNTAYRFLNEGRFHWEKLLTLMMTRLVCFIDQLTGKDRQSVLIIDDSLFGRDRSKKVELLARVFDHTSHTFHKGFRMLTLGWSDGNTFLPLSFQLLSSAEDENVYCPAKQKDKRTLASKRRENARRSATDVLLDLLQAARHIPAKYVLFDSWFTFPKTVVRIKNLKRDVIGMIKITKKVHYLYENEWQDVKAIYQKIKKSADPKAQIQGSVCVRLRENKSDTAEDWVDARIVFVKDRHSKDWLALLCTDLELSDEEIIRLYGKRWDIEVFFKVCKSHLALAKEFQGRNYDMQVAATTIVFLRYAMLAIEARKNLDDRTIGDLFYLLKEEMADVKLSYSLMILIDTLRHVLHELPMISEDLANVILDAFFNALPMPIKDKLLSCA